MAKRNLELNLDEELLILLFWAHGKDIARKFSVEKLQAVPGLEQAIEAISYLPVAIGWDGEVPLRTSKRLSPTSAGLKKR
jgi:hypothetical protein